MFANCCIRLVRLLACWVTVAAVTPVSAQTLFKCGNTYQDRPCASQDVQQRFSHTSGDFSVSQVNADTDKDCANTASEMLPYWQRISGGENVEKLKAEFDARPVSRYEKSRWRDVLLSLKEFKGSPKEVRSELERQCMNYKKANGMPTEKETARAAAAQSDRRAAFNAHSIEAQARAAEVRAAAEERQLRYEEAMRTRAAQAAARAAAEKKMKEQK
jgi:hypothetical protein